MGGFAHPALDPTGFAPQRPFTWAVALTPAVALASDWSRCLERQRWQQGRLPPAPGEDEPEGTPGSFAAIAGEGAVLVQDVALLKKENFVEFPYFL